MNPGQFVEGAEPWAGPFGVKSQQLLAQGEVFEDEVIPRAKDGNNLSRADIEDAQTSENLNEMRAVQAVSQVIDSANVWNYVRATPPAESHHNLYNDLA